MWAARIGIVVLAATWGMGIGNARGAEGPLRILYLGNSYTAVYDVPGIVHALAVDAGFAGPLYGAVAPGSWTLGTHRASTQTVSIIDTYELDVVVLQEQSQRATDPFSPGGFKADATWLYDRIKARSPNARVVLYETWARQAGDVVYPGTYANPGVMQGQLRKHYEDAAENYIPGHSGAVRKSDVAVAPVGDAWEMAIGQFGVGLHDPDRSHANLDGAYLAGLVLFETIYGVRTVGLDGLGRDAGVVAKLQGVADAVVPEPGLGIGMIVGAGGFGMGRRRRVVRWAN